MHACVVHWRHLFRYEASCECCVAATNDQSDARHGRGSGELAKLPAGRARCGMEADIILRITFALQ
jgi:hypothetical protein